MGTGYLPILFYDSYELQTQFKNKILKAINWVWKQITRLLRFLVSRNFLRLLGAALIGVAIYFGETLDYQEFKNLKIGLSIFCGILFLVFDPVADEIEKLKGKLKRKGIIQNHIKPLKKFLEKHLEVKINSKELISEIEESEIDYDKREAVFIYVTNQLTDISQNEKDAILLTALCHEIDNESDILKSERYKVTIAAIFEKYNFLDLDEDARVILRYYSNYQNNKKLNEPIEEIDYLSKTDELTESYNKTYNLSLKLKLEKDQAEEFRRTLAILIRDGKLNVQQLEKNLQKRINQELKNKAISSKAFLVLANKFHKIDGVQKALNRFPTVVYPYKKPNGLPEGIVYLHTRIIYPSSSFQSASDFLEEEIKPHIPEEEINDGFIAIIPIEGTELFSIPKKADVIKKDHLKAGFESIAAYKTGVSLNMTELYMESMKDEINVDEILSNIPFNIFVPNLTESRKNFLITNYDNLKNRFGINRLTDWANIHKDDLKVFLIELDNERDKKRLYSDENWETVAENIVDQAIKHRNAVNN